MRVRRALRARTFLRAVGNDFNSASPPMPNLVAAFTREFGRATACSGLLFHSRPQLRGQAARVMPINRCSRVVMVRLNSLPSKALCSTLASD